MAAPRVEAVDTTGAGDCFNGVFAAGSRRRVGGGGGGATRRGRGCPLRDEGRRPRGHADPRRARRVPPPRVMPTSARTGYGAGVSADGGRRHERRRPDQVGAGARGHPDARRRRAARPRRRRRGTRSRRRVRARGRAAAGGSCGRRRDHAPHDGPRGGACGAAARPRDGRPQGRADHRRLPPRRRLARYRARAGGRDQAATVRPRGRRRRVDRRLHGHRPRGDRRAARRCRASRSPGSSTSRTAP